jgi:hypothetical protein
MSPLARSGRRPAGTLAFVAVSASIALLGSGRAHADHDVDIESLRGELWRANGEWLLEVRYDVEVEDRRPAPGELELTLFVTEHGYTLVDRAGRPIEFVIPLAHPSEVDDDELEFEDRIVVALPDDVFDDPKRLRLDAVVVRVGDDYALDRKSESVKFEHEYPEGWSQLGVRASVAVGVDEDLGQPVFKVVLEAVAALGSEPRGRRRLTSSETWRATDTEEDGYGAGRAHHGSISANCATHPQGRRDHPSNWPYRLARRTV